MKKVLSTVAALAFIGAMASTAMAQPAYGEYPQQGGCLDQYFQAQGWGIDVADYLNPYIQGYELTTASTGSNMTLYHEQGGDYGFGIYSLAGGQEIEVFDADNTAIAQSTVSFLGGDLLVVQYIDNGGLLIDTHTYNFTGETFGFFATSGNQTVYSDEAKNGGVINMLTYKADEGSYVFATDFNNDGNWCDLITQAESINPVPEPATMLLFGTGIAGLAGWKRRKAAKK